MNTNSKIYVLGLCFGEKNISGMIKVADKFCKINFSKNKIIRIVIDNSLKGNHQYKKMKYILLSGDNRNMEFSGWQRGINFIKKEYKPSNHDVIVLINDTVHRRNYTIGGDRYYDKYIIQKDSNEWPSYWAAGYLDDFPHAAKICEIDFTTWIRSNLLAFNWACTDLLYPLVFPSKEKELFCENINEGFWNKDAPVSRNWKSYISCWMFGAEDPQFPEYRLKWIKAEQLTMENRNKFRKKAICILSEHYLTARLQKAGVKIFDFNTYPKDRDRHLKPYYN